MYLLSLLESQLGSIDTWPSYILRFLFVDTPNRATVRRVTVFFCGIKRACRLVAQFFGLCNERAGMAVTQQIYQLFLQWQSSPWAYKMVDYYDV